MIVHSGKYYLYRHIRPDTGNVFNIGIGTKPKGSKSYMRQYSRAFSTFHRNPYWYNIVNLNPNYEVEILLESNNPEFIKQKEIEFVKLYGRKDIKTGLLCNMTDGGDATLNPSKELIEKQVGHLRERKQSQKEKEKRSIAMKKRGDSFKSKNHPNAIRILQYDLENNLIKEWDCLADVGKFMVTWKWTSANIHKCLTGRVRKAFGFKWRYKDKSRWKEKQKF